MIEADIAREAAASFCSGPRVATVASARPSDRIVPAS
jgi:hypothetical protein